MSAELDLTVVSLYRVDGQEEAYLPGLFCAPAPRRAARGRGEDRLVLQLVAPPELGLSAEAQTSLLQDMANGYFRSAGAVTSALREQVERLNSYLFQRNQGGQTPSAVWLALMVLRDGRLTLAHCGPLHGFQLGDQIRHHYDAQGAGRGLGLGQNAQVRFYQFDLQARERVLSLAKLPASWNETTLAASEQTPLAALSQRLLEHSGEQLNAVLLDAQAGSGALHQLSAADLQAPPPPPAKPSSAAPAAPQPAAAQPAAETSSLGDTAPIKAQRVAGAWERLDADTAVAEAEAPAPSPPPTAAQQPRPAALKTQLNAWAERYLPPLRRFLERILPEEPIFNLPPRVMGLVALLVPVAVVILVAVVYLQFGRQQLYVDYLERAQAAAAVAQASQDPAEVRLAWEGVVFYAERAARYEEDQATAYDLLSQAYAALDGMDLIRRMEFSPILSQPLGRDAQITRMVATNNEIYLLDSQSGDIARLFLAGDGNLGRYQVDANFRCGPGEYGTFIVSKLVDLALLPRGNAARAEIIAMDANGNVLYCAQGQPPSAQTLIAPNNHWGQPRALRIANGDLYILDPQTNAVWLYEGEDYAFGEAPRFFFGAEVPSLRNMQDMAVNGTDIYLLSSDGHMVTCSLGTSVDNPTTCDNPADYTDTRPGFGRGPSIEGANFEQVRISEPPQPAVYLLDPVARAVYRFSLTLGLDTQFRSLNELPAGLATAFAVTPSRAVLLAISNDVYIGFLPSE